MQIKQERDEMRKKMKEDILNKKKEMKQQNSKDIKVELVGLPSFMNEGSSSSSTDASTNNNYTAEPIHQERFVKMVPNP